MTRQPDYFVRRVGTYYEVGRVSLKEYPLRLFWAHADGDGLMLFAIGQNYNGWENRDIPHGTKQWAVLQSKVFEILAPHLAQEVRP